MRVVLAASLTHPPTHNNYKKKGRIDALDAPFFFLFYQGGGCFLLGQSVQDIIQGLQVLYSKKMNKTFGVDDATALKDEMFYQGWYSTLLGTSSSSTAATAAAPPLYQLR